MPRPTGDTTIIRPDLGVIVYEHQVNAHRFGFIGLRVLPIIPVALQSSSYPMIPAETMTSVPDTQRAERSGYHRDDWKFEDGSYACREHGLEQLVDDRERERIEGVYSAMDVDEIAVNRGEHRILLAQEKRIADKVFDTSTFTNEAVGVPWSTLATATPTSDIADCKSDIRKSCGIMPNTLIIGYDTFENLTRCQDITSELVYTDPMSMSTIEAQIQKLASIFKLEHVLVGGAIMNQAKRGQKFSPKDIWSSSYAMLCTISSGGPDLEEPCLGRTFMWTQDSDGNPTVETYREEDKRSDVYRVRHDVDEKFIMTGCAKLLTGLSA